MKEDHIIDVPFRTDGGIRSDQAPVPVPSPPLDYAGELVRDLAELVERVSVAIPLVLQGFAEMVVRVGAIFRDAFDIDIPRAGTMVPAGVQIVRPAKSRKPRKTDSWLAWDSTEARWVPIRRVAGVGWVWGE